MRNVADLCVHYNATAMGGQQDRRHEVTLRRHDPSRYVSLASAARAATNSSFCFASIFGYVRSSSSIACTIAAPTTSRVNHLLSAGTTYQGACFDAVARIASSKACM